MGFTKSKRRHTIVGHGADNPLGFMMSIQTKLPVKGYGKLSYLEMSMIKDYKPIQQLQIIPNSTEIKSNPITLQRILSENFYEYTINDIMLMNGSWLLQNLVLNKIIYKLEGERKRKPVYKWSVLTYNSTEISYPANLILLMDAIPFNERLSVFNQYVDCKNPLIPYYYIYTWDYIMNRIKIPDIIDEMMEKYFQEGKIKEYILPYLIWSYQRGQYRHKIDDLYEAIDKKKRENAVVSRFIREYFPIVLYEKYIIPTLEPLMIKIKRELGERDSVKIFLRYVNNEQDKKKIHEIIKKWKEENKDISNEIYDNFSWSSAILEPKIYQLLFLAPFSKSFVISEYFSYDPLMRLSNEDFVALITEIEKEKIFDYKTLNRVKDLFLIEFLFELAKRGYPKEFNSKEYENSEYHYIYKSEIDNFKRYIKYLKKWNIDLSSDPLLKIYIAFQFIEFLYLNTDKEKRKGDVNMNKFWNFTSGIV